MALYCARGICFDNPAKPPSEQWVLLVYESPRLQTGPFGWVPRWRLPGGTCCDNSRTVHCGCPERYAETALREAQKETGLSLKVLGLTNIHREHNFPDGGTHSRYYFITRRMRGSLRRNSFQGVVTPQWFPVEEPPERLGISHRREIYRAQQFFRQKRISVD